MSGESVTPGTWGWLVDLQQRLEAAEAAVAAAAVNGVAAHQPITADAQRSALSALGAQAALAALDGPQDAATAEVALGSTDDPCGPHRGAEGPNEDIGWCYACNEPDYTMRPDNEQFGLHADDCCLPRRHEGRCVGGGDGHAPTPIVRGYWPGMDADVTAARVRFGASGAESDHGGRRDGEGLA